MQLIKRLLTAAMDKPEADQDKAASLVSSLCVRGVVSENDCEAGLELLLKNLSDVTIDVPKAVDYVSRFIEHFLEDKVVPEALLQSLQLLVGAEMSSQINSKVRVILCQGDCTHARTHARTDTHTDTDRQTHTHTHTHTHTGVAIGLLTAVGRVAAFVAQWQFAAPDSSRPLYGAALLLCSGNHTLTYTCSIDTNTCIHELSLSHTHTLAGGIATLFLPDLTGKNLADV